MFLFVSTCWWGEMLWHRNLPRPQCPRRRSQPGLVWRDPELWCPTIRTIGSATRVCWIRAILAFSQTVCQFLSREAPVVGRLDSLGRIFDARWEANRWAPIGRWCLRKMHISLDQPHLSSKIQPQLAVRVLYSWWASSNMFAIYFLWASGPCQELLPTEYFSTEVSSRSASQNSFSFN